jgi:arylsulfatase A-like enzyme
MPDIYRTMIAIGGGALPDLPLDGHDLVPFLRGEVEHSPREDYFYFRGNLQAVRVGDWKLRTMEESPELFNLRLDPSERFNRAAEQPELVETLRQRMEAMGQEVNAKVAGS